MGCLVDLQRRKCRPDPQFPLSLCHIDLVAFALPMEPFASRPARYHISPHAHVRHQSATRGSWRLSLFSPPNARGTEPSRRPASSPPNARGSWRLSLSSPPNARGTDKGGC